MHTHVSIQMTCMTDIIYEHDYQTIYEPFAHKRFGEPAIIFLLCLELLLKQGFPLLDLFPVDFLCYLK